MGNLPNGGGIAGGQRRQRSLLGRLAEQYSPTRSATLLVLPLLLSHASPRRRTLWRQPVGAGSTARSLTPVPHADTAHADRARRPAASPRSSGRRATPPRRAQPAPAWQNRPRVIPDKSPSRRLRGANRSPSARRRSDAVQAAFLAWLAPSAATRDARPPAAGPEAGCPRES